MVYVTSGTFLTSEPRLFHFYYYFFTFFLKNIFYLFIFRERGREGEREEEKHQWVVASLMPPMGDLACNPAMCPDWELNQRPFDLQAITQSIEPHQPGQLFLKLYQMLHINARY